MITTEASILEDLKTMGVDYQYIAHPPVYTCAQADVLRPDLQGVSTKNLFLRDEKGQYYLVMTACEKRLNLKALGKAIGARGRLMFGPPEELQVVLGLEPGSVTVLALVNDPGHQVQLVVDADIWSAALFLCHPLVNTATLVIERAGIERFLQQTGHTPLVVAMPAA